MASALDAVLGLIAQEKQQEQFKSQQLTEAVNIFQRARALNQESQLEKLRMAQQGKYQDATIANQVLDNARQDKQLDLQNKQFGQNQLKILSENRQTSTTNKLKQQEIDLKNKEQEHQLLLEQAAMTGDYSKLLPQQESVPQQQDNSISQRLDVLGLLKQPFAGQDSNAPVKQDSITQNNKFESVQSPSGKWYLKKKEGLDTSGDLSPMDQIKAINLARKVGGTRKIDAFLPIINAELKKGTPIDKIEDNLRFAGQSDKFTGTIRNAAQSVLVGVPGDQAQNVMDSMDDLVSEGDMAGAKELLKRTTQKYIGVEEARALRGKDRTVELLSEIQDDLNNLEKSGFDTNIFNGTAEKVADKLGTVKNPEARRVATKIAAAVQSYRKAMSGAAFSVPESREYKTIFPDIGRTANFNAANINALKEVFSGDTRQIYSQTMGKKNYDELFGGENTNSDSNTTEDLTYSDAKKEAAYQAWKAGQK